MKSVALFPNNKEGKKENYPDYRLVASYKDGDRWVSVTVGQFWKEKNAPAGHPVLKGELSKSFTSKTGEVVAGYSLVQDGDMKPRQAEIPMPEEDTRDYSNGDPDEIDINF